MLRNWKTRVFSLANFFKMVSYVMSLLDICAVYYMKQCKCMHWIVACIYMIFIVSLVFWTVLGGSISIPIRNRSYNTPIENSIQLQKQNLIYFSPQSKIRDNRTNTSIHIIILEMKSERTICIKFWRSKIQYVITF